MIQAFDATFREAVRDALHGLWRTDTLRRSPLLDALPQVRARPADEPPAEALRRILRTHCEQLARCPGDDGRLGHLLVVTFLDSERPKQRCIASDLGMGYSTYRRHLRAAVDELVHRLSPTPSQGVVEQRLAHEGEQRPPM